MSGGSLDYAQYKLDDIASMIRSQCQRPLHLALATHLELVGEALHELEWELSGDTGPNDADKAIRKVISKTNEIHEARKQAMLVLKELQEALK